MCGMCEDALHVNKSGGEVEKLCKVLDCKEPHKCGYRICAFSTGDGEHYEGVR